MEKLDRFAAYVPPPYIRTDLPEMHLYSRSLFNVTLGTQL